MEMRFPCEEIDQILLHRNSFFLCAFSRSDVPSGTAGGGGGGEGWAIALSLLLLGYIFYRSSWHRKNSLGIIGLCPMEEWDVCLSERLQPDVRARIIRCKAQMERFDFSFALHLGEHLNSHTDNLSKDLQGTKVAAVFGQRLPNFTKETATKIRTNQSFDHIYANVACKSEGLLGEPTLPRKRRNSGRTGGWCWYTKLSANCQRLL